MKYLIPKQTQNYWTIGALSIILMFFVPFCGSVAGLGLSLPNTAAGWIVYITVKTLACVLNIMIFNRFVCQAKINVKDNPKYIEACEILALYEAEVKPRSPKEYFTKLYTLKGTGLLITTLLSTICITQAMLTFDYITFISHIVAVVVAIIFGLNTMGDTEEFWIGEFWQYAKMVKGNMEASKADVLETNAAEPDTRGTTLLESPDSTRDTSNI